MFSINTLKDRIKKEPVKFSVLVILFFMVIAILFRGISSYKNVESKNKSLNVKELTVFVQDGCIHCMNAEDFFNLNKFDNINVVYYNLKDDKSMVLFLKTIAKLGIPQDNLGTPIFVFGNNYVVGFGEKQKEDLVNMIKEDSINTNK